jgi:hypothetical protein
MKCIAVDVYKGKFNKNPIWDSYMVGRSPKLQSGTSLFNGKIVDSIFIKHLSYTVAAEIYYEDLSFEYVEDVKRYFYDNSQPHPGQGETPDVSKDKS